MLCSNIIVNFIYMYIFLFCTGTQLIPEGQAISPFQKWPVWDSNSEPSALDVQHNIPSIINFSYYPKYCILGIDAISGLGG